ncbi:DUF6261 family protein [Flavobacterium columnare]|uniref:DUF6261 family protein n=2 Tax=Flavobacterium columnare TaxID=996 RepID=UPI000982080E|nr:DUF6261 family protein [Flavobacterium columnare]MBF6654590.1 hypothetical protein [Flavobacterium columnare]MBF6659028.1 hypothetical protein [Flavobacterium columnare]OOB84187.1 hypothetical protein BZL53_03715 [Flavobacterium columnare]PTD15589.1 hypothetical protein C6N29_14745 [Flavobacterium columnare]
MKSKSSFYFFILILLISCKTTKTNWWEDNKDTPFKRYLIQTNKIDINTKMNGKLYDDYYSDFLKYETKTKLEKNPYLKVNKVYVHYRTSNSVEFSVYSDEEDFCLSDYDLDMDGKILSLPDENTTTLLNIDKRRDDCINGLFYVVQGYEYHFEETLRVAAQKLATNLRFYGSGISRLNYQAETATLTNIINDWETKPELIAALTTLNLTAWKDEMKKQNNAFNTVYLDRTQEYGNATPENLISKRNEANTVYYALRDRITAFHTLIEAPAISPYATSINQLNALIDQYNNLIVGRAKSVDLTTSTQN